MNEGTFSLPNIDSPAPDKRLQHAGVKLEEFKSRSSSGRPPWWTERYADIVERRQEDGTYEPRQKQKHNRKTYPLPAAMSEMLPRPEGMSRQVQRALYRKACKASGFDYRGYGRAAVKAAP